MSPSDGARGLVNRRHAIHALVPNCLRLDLVARKGNVCHHLVTVILDCMNCCMCLINLLVHRL